MTTLRETRGTGLESFETWPIWALGLSNGLNIALWYLLSMARIRAPEVLLRVPAAVEDWLPLAIVLGAIAQAISLDGALIATIAGARHGRRGPWTWLTILGTGLFSAAISYAVHSGQIDSLPGLHVASAVNLIFYNLHLAQPKNALQDGEPAKIHGWTWFGRRKPAPVLPKTASRDDVRTSVKLYTCRTCGRAGFDTLTAVNLHRRTECPGPQNSIVE